LTAEAEKRLHPAEKEEPAELGEKAKPYNRADYPIPACHP